jgi:hypothetical protein
MLAYIFWHRPTEKRGQTPFFGYEDALVAFMDALRAQAPEGFLECASFRVDAPWWPEGYEDWYLVDDWAALGALNEAAPRLAEHGPVAAMAAQGAAGVYRLLHGESALDAPSAGWMAKPAGLPYESWHTQLPEHSAWQRQMVLGPAPEYCLPGEAGVQRSRVA